MVSPQTDSTLFEISLHFDKYDDYGKQIKATTNLFAVSVQYPVEPEDQGRFQDVMASLLEEIPKQYKVASRKDLNASVGV